jgi:hypothetical protein
MIRPSLSDRYGSQRAVALSESNVNGSLCAGIAPIIVGVSGQSALGAGVARSLLASYPFFTVGPFSTRVFS